MLKFSILICTHNRFEKCKRLFDYLQSLENAEIVIVENGSNTEQKQMYKFFNSVNVKYFSLEIGDISAARNKAIKEAAGEYLFMIDDDDLPTKEFIEYLNENQNILDGEIYRFPYYRNARHLRSPLVNGEISLWQTIQLSTLLVRRDFVIKNNLFFNDNFQMHEDAFFMANLFTHSEAQKISQRYVSIPSINYNFDCEEESMSRSEVTRDLIKDTRILDYIDYQNKFHAIIAYRIIIFLTENKKLYCDKKEWRNKVSIVVNEINHQKQNDLNFRKKTKIKFLKYQQKLTA